MKKYLITFLILLTIIVFGLNLNIVSAKNNNFDETINEILTGIDDSNYKDFNDVLNGFFNDNLSFKERKDIFTSIVSEISEFYPELGKSKFDFALLFQQSDQSFL